MKFQKFLFKINIWNLKLKVCWSYLDAKSQLQNNSRPHSHFSQQQKYCVPSLPWHCTKSFWHPVHSHICGLKSKYSKIIVSYTIIFCGNLHLTCILWLCHKLAWSIMLFRDKIYKRLFNIWLKILVNNGLS